MLCSSPDYPRAGLWHVIRWKISKADDQGRIRLLSSHNRECIMVWRRHQTTDPARLPDNTCAASACSTCSHRSDQGPMITVNVSIASDRNLRSALHLDPPDSVVSVGGAKLTTAGPAEASNHTGVWAQRNPDQNQHHCSSFFCAPSIREDDIFIL